MNQFFNNVIMRIIYVTCYYQLIPSILLLLVVHFHVYLTHKQCFDIESQFFIVDLDKVVIFWS